MKTLGHILIILTAFAIVMGITYVAVSAGSSSASTNPPAFERGSENVRAFDGQRPEFEGEGPGGGVWMFGMTKNIVIIAIIVALIVVPKRFMGFVVPSLGSFVVR